MYAIAEIDFCGIKVITHTDYESAEYNAVQEARPNENERFCLQSNRPLRYNRTL